MKITLKCPWCQHVSTVNAPIDVTFRVRGSIILTTMFMHETTVEEHTCSKTPQDKG